MTFLQTVDDSFTFLKDIGMEKNEASHKSVYHFASAYGRGGIEILGDTGKYYLTKVDYHVENGFGQGYCIKEHYIEIGQIRKTDGFYTISERENSKPQQISPGISFYLNLYTGAKSWFYCPKGTQCSGHSLIIREDYYRDKLLPVIYRHYGTDIEPYDILRQIGNQQAQSCGSLLSSLYHTPYQGEAFLLFLSAKVNEFLALLMNAIETTATISALHLSAYDKAAILDAQQILRNNLQHPPSINDLSRQLGLNHNKLQHGFRILTGVTVMGYLRSYRMEKALELLSQDILLEEIARQIGYSSQSRFSETFAKTYGLLPSQYRKYIRKACDVDA